MSCVIVPLYFVLQLYESCFRVNSVEGIIQAIISESNQGLLLELLLLSSAQSTFVDRGESLEWIPNTQWGGVVQLSCFAHSLNPG